MFQKHPLLAQPKNSLQKLWRYLRYDRLLQIINDGQLYFRHISEMSDQWEGLLTEKAKANLYRQQYSTYKNAAEANFATDKYENLRNLFYVNCWHMNNYESYLMWKVYSGKECSIQTTYERLIAAFGDYHPDITGGVMTYIDYERDHFDLGNIYTPVSHKDIPYQDEKEFRLLCWKPDIEKHQLSYGDKGINLMVDVSMLIEKIYINPTADIYVEKLRKLKEEKNLSFTIEATRIKEKKE